MITRNKLMLGVAAVIAMALPAQVSAETITTKTSVEQRKLNDVNQIDFSAFDINKDGIYTMAEVGQKLFYLFDTDGNEVIDNLEFDNKNVMTIIPMKKETVVKVDYNDDGIPEEASHSYETFIQESGLMRFDKNMDGLSAEEFIGMPFLKLDIDKSHAIELKEWKEAYALTHRPSAAVQERYNQ